MKSVRLIEVKENILSENQVQADELRQILREHSCLMVNLMSSPGSGKTTLLEKTVECLSDTVRMGVLEADIDSKVDAERIASMGVQAVQLRTGGFCHLDATMVHRGLSGFQLADLDLVVIENVGNLVCPAEFDTGADINVMLLSIPEGDDKPLKYPLMFTVSDVLIVHKIDYLAHSDFNLHLFKERVFALNPAIRIFEVSSKSGAGVAEWSDWLKAVVVDRASGRR